MGCYCFTSKKSVPSKRPNEPNKLIETPGQRCTDVTAVDKTQEIQWLPSRYCAYPLPTTEPNYVLIYDYQEYEIKIIHLLLTPSIIEYSIAVNYHTFFVFGGVIKDSNEISNKIWTSVVGNEELKMTVCKTLIEARRKPFLVSGNGESIYIIGGFLEGEKQSRVCERYRSEADLLIELPPIGVDHDYVIGTGGHIYAFGEYSSRRIIEVLDMSKEDEGWVCILIQNEVLELPITYLDSFGVFFENETASKVIIFGGQKSHYEDMNQVLLFDASEGKLEELRNILPDTEKFLQPMAETSKMGLALSENFSLYTYDKILKDWKKSDTKIKEAISKKGLVLNKT